MPGDHRGCDPSSARNHLGAGQRRRSDDASVIAKRGHRETQLRIRVQHPRTRRLEDPVGEVLAQLLGHPAADHHQRDVEQVHHRSHPDGDGINASVEQLSGQLVLLLRARAQTFEVGLDFPSSR